MTKEQAARYESIRLEILASMKPELDAIRQSEILTAEDFAVTINATVRNSIPISLGTQTP